LPNRSSQTLDAADGSPEFPRDEAHRASSWTGSLCSLTTKARFRILRWTLIPPPIYSVT